MLNYPSVNSRSKRERESDCTHTRNCVCLSEIENSSYYQQLVSHPKPDSEDGNESEIDVQPNPLKNHCSSSTSKPPSKSESGIWRYNKKWEKTFPWLEFDENLQGAFCKLCKKGGRSLQRTGGASITKSFTNWKKATQKMKSHCEVHLLSCQLDVEAARARKGSIISQLQNVGKQQRLQNRKAIKALIRCTQFLAHQNIAHTTNFDKLVELVVSCGGETLQTFLDRAGGNATYTSKMALVEFVTALGTWVEESLLQRLHKAHFFSIMADECTDVCLSTVTVMSFNQLLCKLPMLHQVSSIATLP